MTTQFTIIMGNGDKIILATKMYNFNWNIIWNIFEWSNFNYEEAIELYELWISSHMHYLSLAALEDNCVKTS